MTIDDMTDDLDTELRSDADLWREQVDGLRPEFTPAPEVVSIARPRRVSPYLSGLVAAALVLGAVVLVLALRNTTTSGTPAAGQASPPVATTRHGKVPAQAKCVNNSGGGSGFGAMIAPGATGSRTIAQAVRVAKYGPRNIAAWHIAVENHHAALLLSGSRYLHVKRLHDGSWFVDSGGKCGSGTATLP
jgi:hypothetical protein